MRPRLRHPRRGGNAIEFALCLPVFLLVMFGTADFGWIAWNWTSLSSTAAIACRAGSTRDPGDGEADLGDVVSFTEDVIDDQLARDGLPCTGCDVDVEAIGSNPDRSLRCRIRRDVMPLTGMVDAVSGGITLTGVAITRFEYQR
jgi:hypothetical protein